MLTVSCLLCIVEPIYPITSTWSSTTSCQYAITMKICTAVQISCFSRQLVHKAEEDGEDYDRVKLWDKGADELGRMQRKRKKKNPDVGFSDYQQATFRQYQRLTKQLKPDLEAYERQKEELGQDFFPTSSSLLIGKAEKTVNKSGLDRMAQDLQAQIDKRSKYSRRREFQHDADVDYINERNMKFNHKTARFYNKCTAEIKQNLERGTAP
ncbi:pre-mRNA-splicing factor syf2-like isoform X2 [Dysidea avara]|uniref:pre-mRNA-splicing factor syf2-like isoform X2 n=1 Tax=Dysidea avara TaxID=196820 RepID=UPI003332FC6A